jgi:hypothetical protein
MLEFPALLRCIAFALEEIVAPLTMLWFAYQWSHLPVNDEYPHRARRVASAGVTVGLLMVPLFLFAFFHFYNPPAECTPATLQASLSRTQMSIAYFKDLCTSPKVDTWFAVGGLVVGVLTSFAEGIRRKVLKPNSTAGVNSIENVWSWLIIVGLTTGLSVASVIIYYIGKPYRVPHFVLMWAYLALLCGHRIVSVKDSL